MLKPDKISNPVCLDSVIQDLQIYLQNNLPEIEFVFGKCFKNETKSGKYIPEIYTGKNEYFEVFSNDNLKSFIFFDVAENRNAEYQGSTSVYKLNTVVRIIVSANLQKIYPNLEHRATEELILDVQTDVNNYIAINGTWEFKKIIEGAKNVYSNYNYEIKDSKTNMQPYYCFALEYNVNYKNRNNNC
jgi:hypothetical protein